MLGLNFAMAQDKFRKNCRCGTSPLDQIQVHQNIVICNENTATSSGKIKLVRQSQTVQSEIHSPSMVVIQVLTPAQFTLGLYFSLAEYERIETLIRHNLSSVYFSCVYFYSRSKDNFQLLINAAFELYCGVLPCFSFMLNSI